MLHDDEMKETALEPTQSYASIYMHTPTDSSRLPPAAGRRRPTPSKNPFLGQPRLIGGNALQFSRPKRGSNEK